MFRLPGDDIDLPQQREHARCNFAVPRRLVREACYVVVRYLPGTSGRGRRTVCHPTIDRWRRCRLRITSSCFRTSNLSSFATDRVGIAPISPSNSSTSSESGVGSLVNTMKNGDASEVGTIGNEGVVGLPVVFGDTRAHERLNAGSRQRPTDERSQLPRNPDAIPSIREALLHYAAAFCNQVAQSAACANHHLLEQRCCRWLLMTRDRMNSNEFRLTQEFLAMMLGVRRPGVTVTANALQRAGLISYRRGHIAILDGPGLERRSCECYAVDKE